MNHRNQVLLLTISISLLLVFVFVFSTHTTHEFDSKKLPSNNHDNNANAAHHNNQQNHLVIHSGNMHPLQKSKLLRNQRKHEVLNANRKRRLMIFDTSIGRMSNQLLTITAAMALATALNRTAVLPPLFLGGGKGGGGSRVVPLTELFDFDRWKVPPSPSSLSTQDQHPPLYCDPQFDYSASASTSTERRTPQMCFFLESELSSSHNTTVDAFWSKFSSSFGCMKMKGVSTQPVARKTRSPSSIFDCSASSNHKLLVATVDSKKKIADVLQAGRKLSTTDILFVPLTMYVADVLENPLVTRAWASFSMHPEMKNDIFDKCRETILTGSSSTSSSFISLRQLHLLSATKGENTSENVGKDIDDEDDAQQEGEVSSFPIITVGIHLRALEGSCRDRVKQVIREAKLLTGGGDGAPPAAEQILESHCKLTSDDVVRVAQRSLLEESTSSSSKKDVVVYVADDGQQNAEEKKSFLDGIQRGLLTKLKSKIHAVSIQTLSICHKLDFSPQKDSKFNNNWIRSSSQDAVAKGTLSLMGDFWQLVEADIFVGNQLSTVSVNICRRRLSQGKLCQNFVTPSSAAVGKLKWSLEELLRKY